MANKMKTGRAYAYFDYTGRESNLARDIAVSKRRANFSETFSVKVIDDKVSANYNHERKELPANVAAIADATDVYGSVSSKCSSATFAKLSREPVKASSLRYLLVAEAPEVTDSTVGEPLGQWRANQQAAGMLGEVLRGVAGRERRRGASDVCRDVVFYLDSRRKAQRYS